MIDDLILFVNVINSRTFQHASNTLGIPKATISRRLQLLEEHLGLQLIYRTASGIDLTADGKMVYANFAHYASNLPSLLDNILNQSADLSGTLSIVISPALAAIITSYLNEFLEVNPLINLQIFIACNYMNYAKTPIHIWISQDKPTSNSLCNYKFLLNYSHQLFATPEYVAAYGLPQNISELAKHSLLGIIRQDGEVITQYSVIDIKTGISQIFNYQPLLACSQISEVIELIKTNQYMGWLYQGLADMSGVELIAVQPDLHFESQPLYVCWNNLDQGRVVAAFIDFMEECVNKNRGSV